MAVVVEGGGFQILTFGLGIFDFAWMIDDDDDAGGGMLLYLLEGGAIREARGS